MSRSRRYELGVGCLLAAALVVLGWMALQVGALSGFGPRTVVEVHFDDASGLQTGAVVAVAGVEVGAVDSLTIDHDHAIVSLGLDPSAGIRRDARARIRARSVLGEKYVELMPQSREAQFAVDGDVLASWGTNTEIDELVSALGPLIEHIDPDAMGEMFKALAQAIEDDPERLKRMLENADIVLVNAAEASKELPALAAEGRATLRATRATLAEIDARAEESEAVIASASDVLTTIDEAAEGVPDLMVEIESAVGDARTTMSRFEASSDDLETILGNIAEIDKYELRRLLREEGVLIRLRKRKVVEDDEMPWSKHGRTVRGKRATSEE